MNADPFSGSRRKLARAHHHIRDLEEQIRTFYQTHPCSSSVEPDPDRPGKNLRRMRVGSPLPEHFADIVGDAAVNLRSVLDHAVHATAIPAHPNTRSAAFPFSQNAAKLKKSISNRCGDVPKGIVALIEGFRPHGDSGGNALLFALNGICNQDKHRTLIPMAGAVSGSSLYYATSSYIGPSAAIFVHHVSGSSLYYATSSANDGVYKGQWDSANNEIVLRFFGNGSDPDCHIHYTLNVTFSNTIIMADKPAVTVLNALAGEVERVLLAIEAEAFRLEIF